MVSTLVNEWMWASSGAAGPEVAVEAAAETAAVAAWVMTMEADS